MMNAARKNERIPSGPKKGTNRTSGSLKSSFYQTAILMAAAGILLLAFWIVPWLRAPLYSQSAFGDVEQAVLSVNDPAYYPKQSDQAVRRYLSITEGDAAEIGFFRQDDAFSAREIIIARFDDDRQKQAMTDKIEKRKQSQIDIYSGYAPEQQAMMENALLDVQGNYLLFYTGDAAGQSDQAFLDALRKGE